MDVSIDTDFLIDVYERRKRVIEMYESARKNFAKSNCRKGSEKNGKETC